MAEAGRVGWARRSRASEVVGEREGAERVGWARGSGASDCNRVCERRVHATKAVTVRCNHLTRRSPARKCCPTSCRVAPPSGAAAGGEQLERNGRGSSDGAARFRTREVDSDKNVGLQLIKKRSTRRGQHPRWRCELVNGALSPNARPMMHARKSGDGTGSSWGSDCRFEATARRASSLG